jgi:hypothetical protein
VTDQGDIHNNPLYRLGESLNGIADAIAGRLMTLLDGAAADPSRFLTLLAFAGLACAILAWGFGSAFVRLNRPPPRPAPQPAAPAPQVVIQAGRGGRLGGTRRPPARPRRHGRRGRRKRNPLMRWLGWR